jgi:hypothetical protein
MGLGSGLALVLLGGGRLLAQAAAGASATPARPWWLTVSSLLGNAAIVAGVVALLGASRGQGAEGRGNLAGARRPGRIAAGGVVLLALGALARALLPAWPPKAREIVTDRIFSSSRMPAIDLELPPGWRLTHGNAEGIPDVVTATSAAVASGDAGATADADAGAPPGAILVVQSARLDETVDVARLARELATGLQQKGSQVAPPAETEAATAATVAPTAAPTAATIDGQKALVLRTTRDDKSQVSVWIVKRADRFVSYVYCITQPGVVEGCAPALTRLRWRAPENLSH